MIDMLATGERMRRAATVMGVSLPIHVCHVMTADLWAGAEVQVRTLGSYLAQRPDVRLTAVLFNDGRLAEELRTFGVPVVVLDERQLTSAQILARLTGVLRSRGIDVVHTHRYKDTVLGVLAAALAGVSHVVRTVHGLAEPLTGWKRLRYRLYERLDQGALRWRADRIIAVSNDLAETLRAQGYPRSAVIPIHNGLDRSRLGGPGARADVREHLGIPSDAFVVGTIGRLSAVKGHEHLLRAGQRLRPEIAQMRLLIVGSGPLDRELQTRADQLGLNRHVVFPGAVDEAAGVLRAMDVFVLPSLHEGIPMALLEAMALGKPVVAAAVGGVPEIVTNRVNGLLVPPGDDRALASACLDLYHDRQWAEQLGETGRQTVANRFSDDVNGAAVLDVYRSVLAADRSPAPTGASDLGAASLSWELVRGLCRIARRRVERLRMERRERVRMRRLRRHPVPLARALQSARAIMMVCHGNIIRSPFAAALMTQAVSEAGTAGAPRIASAGIAAVAGASSHPTAVRLATDRSIDLTRHAASPLSADAVAASDLIFVMDVPQLITVAQRFPEARRKTFLLSCLAADAPLEIGDPVDGDESCFRACFDHIARAVHPIVNTLGAVSVR